MKLITNLLNKIPLIRHSELSALFSRWNNRDKIQGGIYRLPTTNNTPRQLCCHPSLRGEFYRPPTTDHRLRVSAPRMLGLTTVFLFLMLVMGSTAYAATTVEVTTNVLIKNVPPSGTHMVNDYYSGTLTKKRYAVNFEGSRFRRVYRTVLTTNGCYVKWVDYNGVNTPNWEPVITNSDFYIVSDPAKGVTGKIVKMANKTINYGGAVRTWCFLTFDQPISLDPPYEFDDVGVFNYNDSYLTAGNVGQTGTFRITANNNFIVTNDCAPGSFGNSSCRMDGTSDTSKQQFQCLADGGTTLNTSWRIGFWLKKDSGTPTVKWSFGYSGAPQETVTVPTGWEHREVILDCDVDRSINASIQVSGGSILIDDILIEQIEGDSNFPCRTEAINIYKEFNPGVLRAYTSGGMSIEDQLKPNLETYGFNCEMGDKLGVYEFQSKETITLSDACFACEEIGCSLHYNCSGTIFPWEITNMIEFLAAPTNTYWGNERAKQGHPIPWTESIKEIHIEIGNEAWNTFYPYIFKGFNGPDYWNDIINYAKNSPYFTNNIIMMPAGQAGTVTLQNEIIGYCTNADTFLIGAYTDRYLFDTDRTTLGDEGLFNWFMANMTYEAYNRVKPHRDALPADVDLAFYEYNTHTSHGDAPAGDFALLTPSLAQGIGLANYSLVNLEVSKIRWLNFYNITGKSTYGSPLFGLMHVMKPGEQHKRPVWYANMIMNKVREGNLMETVQSGDNPSYYSYGRFYSKTEGDFTSNEFKTIYSYAFQNNGTNGIILFNYDLNNSQDVVINLKEYVKDETAEKWTLTSDTYTNNNETVQGNVTSDYSVVSNFKSGYQISMPPCSEIVFKWTSDGDFPDLKTSVTNLYINEGNTADFNVMLTSEPKTAVTVSVARVSGDTDITVQSGSPAVLDASNWDTGETITLAAAEDDDMELGEAVIQCTAEGMTTVEVTAHELENDNGILVNPSDLSVPENGNADFYVRLSTDPGGALAVSVTKISGDENISALPATLNFDAGNWQTEQSVTVSAAEDPDIENGKAVIACTATGYLSNTVAVTEADNDTVALVVSETVLKVPEGGTNVFSVTLTAIPPDNSTITVYRVSGDSDLFVTNGQNLVFDSTNWDVDHFVTIFAKEDADKKISSAVFKCEPLFPNTDGAVELLAYETENDTINISFQRGVLPDDSYTNGIADTRLVESAPNDNYGDSTMLRIRDNTDAILFRWDLSSIPDTASVTWATITLTTYILGGPYDDVPVEVFQLKRDWTEMGATWNNYDDVNPWQTAGGKGDDDKYNTVLYSGILPFADESVVLNLNDSGLAAINSWIHNSKPNNGFIFVPTAGGRTFIRSSEANQFSGGVSNRPMLTLGYTFDVEAPTNASIIINNGDSQTTNFVVELALFAENPTPIDMQLSELSDFSGASWIPYQTNYTYTFGAPFAEKTLYARFSDGGAGISETVSDTIDIIPEPGIVFSIQCSVFGILCLLRKKLKT